MDLVMGEAKRYRDCRSAGVWAPRSIGLTEAVIRQHRTRLTARSSEVARLQMSTDRGVARRARGFIERCTPNVTVSREMIQLPLLRAAFEGSDTPPTIAGVVTSPLQRIVKPSSAPGRS